MGSSSRRAALASRQPRHQVLERLLPRLAAQPGNEVRTAPGAKHLAAEEIRPERHGPKRLLEGRIEAGPPASMLFRPEEVHSRSAEGPILRWAAHLRAGVPHDARRRHRD